MASQQSESGEELTAREGRILLSPNLFANASHTDDARPNLLFPYQKLVTDQYQRGFSQQTPYGLSGTSLLQLARSTVSRLDVSG